MDNADGQTPCDGDGDTAGEEGQQCASNASILADSTLETVERCKCVVDNCTPSSLGTLLP